MNQKDLYNNDFAGNYNRLSNVSILRKTIHRIENNVGRELNNIEKNDVRNMINEDSNTSRLFRRNPNKFYLSNLSNLTDDKITEKLSNKWISISKNRNCEPEINNIHETLKKEIYKEVPKTNVLPINNFDIKVNSILGFNERYDLLRLFNPNALQLTKYLYLDSRLRNIANCDGINKFFWNEDRTGNVRDGSFSYIGHIKNIIEIKILPFRIPYPSDGSADNDFRQITMFFEEFSNQSFIGRENSRFHIISRLIVSGNWIDINTNNSNEGVFKFEKPITNINHLTVSFKSPIHPINFDIDRLNCTFSYANPTILTFTQNHNLVTGNTITFKDFNTADPSADSTIINSINNILGLIATYINPTQVSIPVDSSSIIVAPITEIVGLSIICIFDSKTFQIPIQIKYIQTKDIDNTPTHY